MVAVVVGAVAAVDVAATVEIAAVVVTAEIAATAGKAIRSFSWRCASWLAPL